MCYNLVGDGMEILDGRKAKIEILNSLKEKLLGLESKLGLTVIQIGEDPASKVYVRQKEIMANNMGYNFNHIKLSESVTEIEVLDLIEQLNVDDMVDGILVQMPIPRHLNCKKIQNAINPYKDVDGLTDINMGKLVHGVDTLVPCTPYGILDLLRIYNISVEGKNITIIGRSDLVGKPLASLLTNENATVTLCHSKTNNLKLFTSIADILIVAVGKPNFINSEYIKEGAVVVDVGINRLEDGSLCGDVDFDSVKEKASYVTPVPGGVGQMTVAELAKNTYKAHVLRKKQ